MFILYGLDWKAKEIPTEHIKWLEFDNKRQINKNKNQDSEGLYFEDVIDYFEGEGNGDDYTMIMDDDNMSRGVASRKNSVSMSQFSSNLNKSKKNKQSADSFKERPAIVFRSKLGTKDSNKESSNLSQLSDEDVIIQKKSKSAFITKSKGDKSINLQKQLDDKEFLDTLKNFKEPSSNGDSALKKRLSSSFNNNYSYKLNLPLQQKKITLLSMVFYSRLTILLLIFMLAMPLPYYTTSSIKQMIIETGHRDSVATPLIMIQALLSSVGVLANVLFLYFLNSHNNSLRIHLILSLVMSILLPFVNRDESPFNMIFVAVCADFLLINGLILHSVFLAFLVDVSALDRLLPVFYLCLAFANVFVTIA
jgi:hypothetical protein